MTDRPKKPILDEQSFEKLLEAAYVLQEHNRKMRDLEESLESQSEQLREQDLVTQALHREAQPESEQSSRAKSDYTVTLAEIVEAQHQIQMRHLGLDKAIAVVAERVARITGASGAGIGILEGTMVHYRAAAGAPALPVGSEVPLPKAICQANIRTGQVIRTEETDKEFLFDPEPCLERGIRSLLSVPIHYDGNIVGALELYFERIRGFAEQDIHTCQLMAGLVTEAIGRDADSKVKTSMAAERSSMLATIEKLKPSLTALAGDQSPSAANPSVGTNGTSETNSSCWNCGTHLIAKEQFCGKCGAPRAGEAESSSGQSKLASARRVQRHSSEAATQALLNRTQPGETANSTPAFEKSDEVHLDEEKLEDEENAAALSTALTRRQEDMVWGSAAKAQDFLESLAATRKPSALSNFWRSRRGDFYLAFALILVVVVIRWGIWSDNSVVAGRGAGSGSASRSRRSNPDADLSAFDKLLVGLGLADAPDEPPQYKGTPDTQVWIDLNTALYYCPGSDLYAKTPKGKLSSQRDAQLDQFEPANRKACD